MAPKRHTKVVKRRKMPKHGKKEPGACHAEACQFLTAPKYASIESWLSKIRDVSSGSQTNPVLEGFRAEYGLDGHLNYSSPKNTPPPPQFTPFEMEPATEGPEIFNQYGQIWMRTVGGLITPAIPTRPSPMYQLPDGNLAVSPIRGAIREEAQRLVRFRQGSDGVASLRSFKVRERRRVRSSPSVLSQKRVIKRVRVTVQPTIKEEPESEPTIPPLALDRPCSRQPCPMPGCDTVFEAGELNASFVAAHFHAKHSVQHCARRRSGFVRCPDVLGRCSLRNRHARCSGDLVGFGKHVLKIHMKAYGTPPRIDLDD